MQLIGFNFTKISGKRELEQKDKLKINYNIEILDITKENIPLIKEDNILRFSFKYTISYDPKYALIEFEGFILVALEQGKIKAILKEWKKKKVTEEVRITLFNIVMTKCNIKALQLAEDLSLPPHIPLPRLAPQSQEQQQNANYTG